MDAEKIKNWRERVGIEPKQKPVFIGFAGWSLTVY